MTQSEANSSDPQKKKTKKKKTKKKGSSRKPSDPADSPPAGDDKGAEPDTHGDNTDPSGLIKDLDPPADDAGLGQRILWVRENLPSIEKEKHGGLSYEVITHEYINQFMRPLMCKAGLIDMLTLLHTNVVNTGKTQGDKQNPVIRCESYYDYYVMLADNPEEFLSMTVEGHGEDQGDKAPGKAQTYAFKGGRMKMFSIAAGDNEEARMQDTRGAGYEPVSPANLDLILKTADELFGDESDKAIEYLCNHQAFMLNGDIKNLPDRLAPTAIELLERVKKTRDHRGDDAD